MPARLVQLQRKFLYQLIVLIFVPLAIVVRPTVGFSIILNKKLYGYHGKKLLRSREEKSGIFSAWSSGYCYLLALVLMTSPYHGCLCLKEHSIQHLSHLPIIK